MIDKEKFYAPVLITVMNRKEHLQRCVESLQQNPFAKDTDLFISVDYPLEPYDIGWENVIEYTTTITGFKTITVYTQDQNLGICGNRDYLIERIRERGYDRFIFTEDDNTFSPNFIEFMDRALKKFKDNSKVFCICSQTCRYIEMQGNYFLSPWVSVWGAGYWLNKWDQAKGTITADWYNKKVFRSLYALGSLYSMSPALFFQLGHSLSADSSPMWFENGDPQFIDFVQSIYCIIEKKCAVYPKIRMERNWGYDGSGANCTPLDFDPMGVEIDTSASFPNLLTSPILIKQSVKNNNLFKVKRNYPKKRELLRAFLIFLGKRNLSPSLFELEIKLMKHLHPFRFFLGK